MSICVFVLSGVTVLPYIVAVFSALWDVKVSQGNSIIGVIEGFIALKQNVFRDGRGLRRARAPEGTHEDAGPAEETAVIRDVVDVHKGLYLNL